LVWTCLQYACQINNELKRLERVPIPLQRDALSAALKLD
jgi:hypothetical protein